MSDLLCPKCSSDKIFADKDKSGLIRLTCLSCSFEFRPGGRTKSLEEIRISKKLKNQANIVIGVIIIGIIIFILLLKFFNNSSKKNITAHEIINPLDLVFMLDSAKLKEEPFGYLDNKAMEIGVLFKVLNKKQFDFQSLHNFINRVSLFDSTTVVKLAGKLSGIGYLTCNVTNKDSIKINVISSYLIGSYRVKLTQGTSLNRFMNIMRNKMTIGDIERRQNIKVKFESRIFYNKVPKRNILIQINNFNSNPGKELDLLQHDFIKIRNYTAEFESIELIQD